jgi:hypothetical protein
MNSHARNLKSTAPTNSLNHSRRKALNHSHSNLTPIRKSTYKEHGTRSNLLAKALVQLNLQVVAGSKELLHRVILMTFLEIHDHLPQSNQHPLKNRNDT